MFGECSGLTSLDLSNFNTQNVTNMENMFSQCSGLTSLDLSSFNTQNVTTMLYMFHICSSLTTIYAGSGWSTAAVTESNYMFSSCTKLVGGAGTTYDANHTDHTYAHIDGGTANPGYFTDKNATPAADDIIQFADANVKAICVKNWDSNGDGELSKTEAAAVTNIGKVFVGDRSLTSFDELEYFTGLTAIADSAFYFCSSIASIRLPQQVKGIGSAAFYAIENLTNIELPEGIEYIGNAAFTSCLKLKSIHIPSSVSNIVGNPFSHCTELEQMTVGDGNTTYDSRNNCNAIVLTSTNTLISGCKGTTIVEGIVTIGELAFDRCAFITPPSFPSTLKTIGTYAFNACSGMEKLVIADGVETFSAYAFVSSDIAEVTFPSTLKNMDSFCFEYNNLRSVSVPSSVTYIGQGVFCNNIELEELIVDSGNEVYSSQNCNVIFETNTGRLIQASNKMTFPEGVTSLGWSSFQGLAHITKLDIPEGVTDLGNYTFYPCPALEEVSIPSTISAGGFYNVTFYDCVSLKSIYCYIKNPSDLPMTYAGPFGCNGGNVSGGDVDLIYKQATLYVPYGTKALYQSCAGWSKFQNIVEMDPTAADIFNKETGVMTVGGEIPMADALRTAGGVEEVASTITAIVWNNSTALTQSDLQGISNPNLLVYVNEAALAPSGVQNVVVNGQAREIVLTDATSGNNNFYVPQAFTAERISYTRNFAQSTQVGVSRGWESIALPFDVQTITHETKGVIAPFGNTASNRHFWLRELGSNGLQSATGIAANTPYVISMPNSSDYTDNNNLAGRVTFAAENATIPVTEVKATAMADESIVMIPTMQRQERSSEVWALNVGEVRGRYLEGSVFERDYREVRPFEAFTVHRQENTQPAPRYVPLQEIGGTTGINVMEDVRSKKDDVWYTTDGRKLQGKPAAKGVYIHKGQKIVVR